MFDMFIMDMGGHDDNVQGLVQRFPHARVVRYYDNHLDTIQRCMSRCRTPFAWIISSCCDYTNFDFDFDPSPWESYQIHCWASGNQKFGDTFLIGEQQWQEQKDVELLEWYKDINYHTPGVDRFDWPLVRYNGDHPIVDIKQHQYQTPYVQFAREQDPVTQYQPQMWRDRAVHTFNHANSVSLVPRDILKHLDSQIYDYPHIIKQKEQFLGEKMLDIVYISNGEPDAERWYKHLCDCVQRPVKRVQNVDGRRQAYQQAAESSETDWFFAVFAKLEVVEDFDWLWQPDYLREPKHYIFYSHNPVNGLEYGHMGVIAYNKKLVLANNNPGLDFTLTQAHDVVPIVSAIAHYNTTPELTWRTAFREVIKLKDDILKTQSIESESRLDVWLNKAEGAHSEWSLKGSRDAVSYYNTVKGDYDQLMLSFGWDWLHDYFNKKYNT